MADSRLTDKTLFAGTLAAGDLVHIVDVSDLSQNPAGSSFKLPVSALKTFATPSLAEALATGRAVDATGTIQAFGGVLAINVNSRILVQSDGVTTSLNWNTRALTGNWTAVTQAPLDNSTNLATTAYVNAAVAAVPSGWALNGNTVVSEKWLGTIDNFQLPFRVNNVEEARLITDAFLVGVTANVFSSKLLVRKDQNLGTRISVVNNTSGTAGHSQVRVGDLSTSISISHLSALYTSSTIFLADHAVIASTAPAGFNIGTDNAADFKIYTNGFETAIFKYTTGSFGLGISLPTARIHIKGAGATSATKAFLIENSAADEIFKVLDNGAISGTAFGAGVVGGVPEVGSRFHAYLDSTSARFKGFSAQQASGNNYEVHGVHSLMTGTNTGFDNYGLWSTASNSTTNNYAAYLASGGSATGTPNNYGAYITMTRSAGHTLANTYGVYSLADLTAAGGSATLAVAGYFKAAGATSNYSLITDGGFAGFGITAPTAQIHVKGSGATSSTFAAKFENSASTALLSLRNDGVSIFGATAPLSSEFVSIQKDQNAITQLIVSNTTSGTAGRSVISALVASLAGVTIQALSAGYTTSSILVANTGVLNSSMSGGLNMGSTASAQASIWTNNVKRIGVPASTSGLEIYGTTSGSITLNVPATAGSNTITFPAGTTNFSATGGASQVVKQLTAGGAFTVGTLSLTDIANVAEGSYTPTITMVTNVFAVTAQKARYIRVGSRVFISGTFSADATGAGAAEVGIDLPIASALATSFDASGVGKGPGTETSKLTADATNDRIKMNWTAVDISNAEWTYNASYDII